MRFTIERIRTAVLVTAILLVVAIGVFLGLGRWRRRFISHDIPQRLGIDIQQEANGVTYTQAHGGHTLFKIHASRVVQLRNNHATLKDVVIELYGKDGARVDRIQGAEFEYDQKTTIATAAGEVAIEMARPAASNAQGASSSQAASGSQSSAGSADSKSAAQSIRVKTSGVTFNQNTGIVTTAQHVEFSTGQGSGSAVGASFDSELGYLILNSNVELNSTRGNNKVTVHAAHAEFNRDTQICILRQATAQSSTQQATATQALITFHADGAIERINATSGFTIATNSGSRIAAPTGAIQFAANNQPQHAHFEGGVLMDSTAPGRTLHGAAPIMEVDFSPTGDLRHAHLERGVEMHSVEEQNDARQQTASATPTQLLRAWHSPVADVDFRNVSRGVIEPASLHGSGGVTVTSESRRANAAPIPARLAADDLVAQFGPHSSLLSMTGTGHASIDQTATTGAHQTATGDRLDAKFNPASAQPVAKSISPQSAATSQSTATPQLAQIQTAQLDGHVVLIDQPAPKPGSTTQQPMRATAGHALYETASTNGAAPEQWLRLTINPRITDGGVDLTANNIDVAQSTGDAFARGNVKATWQADNSSSAKSSQSTASLGGNGPAHVIAAEAQLRQSTGEATFRGHARLWQDQNSISAPVIVLNRQQQSLTAQAIAAAEPVIAVLLSSEAVAAPQSSSTQRTPTVVRVRSGDLHYSAQDRKALLRAAPLPSVTAQTGTVDSSSDQLELYLTPATSPGQPIPTPSPLASTQGRIDRIIAQGHVILNSQGRRGAGAQLVYTAQTGNYVLTGTTAAPPRMTDPQRGSVTGQSLLFNSRDDSVSIEGGSQPTTTQTTAPR